MKSFLDVLLLLLQGPIFMASIKCHKWSVSFFVKLFLFFRSKLCRQFLSHFKNIALEKKHTRVKQNGSQCCSWPEINFKYFILVTLVFFKKMAYHGLFLFIFVLFKHKFLLKQDLSSDCRNRRQASWPLDHPLFASYASQFYIVCLNSISSHSYANFHMNDAIGDDLICFVVKSPLLTLM